MGMHVSGAARWVALVSAPLLLGACGGARGGVPLEQLQPAPTTTVRAGDIIEVEFWGQPEISGERIVDDDGAIQMPLLRAVQVAGLSAEEIRERLTELYDQYYSDPLIVVNVQLGVSITGAVNGPGRYTVDPALNLLDLIGLARGLEDEAKRDKLELNRAGQRYIVDLDEALLLEQPRRLRLQSGDWVYVPRRFWTLRRTSTYLLSAVLALQVLDFFVDGN